MKNETQLIGMDIGRGYVKAYSEVDDNVKKTIFKSVYGDGRDGKVEFKDYKEPKYIEFENNKYFVGILAEKESHTPIRNTKDSKVTNTAKVLLATALNDIVVKDKVKIVFGVPYTNFKQSVLKEVINTYKGSKIKVKDKLTGGLKEIEIEDVKIFREGDAALLYALNGKINEDKTVGLAAIGFRTTELSYFDKGFVFNDKLSDSLDFGNMKLLTLVKEELESKEIYKDLNEIDTSNDYDIEKQNARRLGSENLEQRIEEKWINKNEMDLYVAGGTSINLELGDEFKKIDDPQMATAKGLFEVAKRTF